MSKFDSGGDLVSQEANQSTMIGQFVKHLKDQWDQQLTVPSGSQEITNVCFNSDFEWLKAADYHKLGF